MSYYANYSGNIKFSNIVPKELIKEADEIFENFYYDENDGSADFGGNDRYSEDDMYRYFEKITPYTLSGEIEYVGEDNSIWRFIFKDGEWREESGRIEYGDSKEISLSLRPEFIGQIIDIFDDEIDPDKPTFTGKKYDNLDKKLTDLMKGWRVF